MAATLEISDSVVTVDLTLGATQVEGRTQAQYRQRLAAYIEEAAFGDGALVGAGEFHALDDDVERQAARLVQ